MAIGVEMSRSGNSQGRPFGTSLGAFKVWPGDSSTPSYATTWRVGVSIALAMLLAAILAQSVGAAPVHPPKPAWDINGLNHACGIATDSQGDVYVTSGDSEVRIYAEGVLLGSIANPNGPCGLAVDSDGNVYVSESSSGEVVRYKPTAYPFVGSPAYGPRTVIDSSGDAEGISVDPFDDRLYVARGDHIATYDAEGKPGSNEVQSVAVGKEGGFFRLAFKGSAFTAPIPADAEPSEVEAALESLSTIGLGNVSVDPGTEASRNEFIVTFEDSLELTDQPLLQGDGSELGGFQELLIHEDTKGFNGKIGLGVIGNASGVAAYTYKGSDSHLDRYVFVADTTGSDKVYTFGGGDIRALELRHTNEGLGTPDGSFGFGTQGAYLLADKGTCPPTAQACTAGHLFVYDAGHGVVDEFEAGGRFVAQIEGPNFDDAEPTAIAVDRSSGPRRGALYVTTGAGPGAKALAFGPLPLPSRTPVPDRSLELTNASGVAIDSHGNRYVAADSFIHIYGPSGQTELATIANSKKLSEIAVDDEGRVYALDDYGQEAGRGRIVYFEPDSFPLQVGTDYSAPTVIVNTSSKFFPVSEWLLWFAINPANGHIFVTQPNRTIELDSVANGADVLDPQVAPMVSSRTRVTVDETSGNVFMLTGGGTDTVANVLDMGVEGDAGDEKVIARFDGTGSPSGSLGFLSSVAVDQATGHLLTLERQNGVVEEYDEAGTFVAQVGEFKQGLTKQFAGIAVDNSGGVNDGGAYAAYFGAEDGQAFEGLHAFGPLSYGEPPTAVTGSASEVGGGAATLNGTVNPNNFAVQSCLFEFLTDEEYEQNEDEGELVFTGSASVACVEGAAELGNGTKSVPVHAKISGLVTGTRYRYRLAATNQYGSSEGKAGLFGPASLSTEAPLPISYTEATARAEIDPSGLATEYFVEYGSTDGYGQSTTPLQLAAADGPQSVAIHLFGLTEAQTYHLRVVASNEAGESAGLDQELTTLQRRPVVACPNQEYRVGRSSGLPDCRAYELVTPADTRGTTPYAFPAAFSSWFVNPRGVGTGESLAYFVNGTLPGYEGNGRVDGYRTTRGSGEHPSTGWSSTLFGPTYDQVGGGEPAQAGIASDQEYSFWDFKAQEETEGVLANGAYLRTPKGFELIGVGGLATDPQAVGLFLGRSGSPVLFSSKVHLENGAAPPGTTSIYARVAGAASATVISVRSEPNAVTPFGTGEDARYVGTNESGSAVAFAVGNTLYLHRGGETFEISSTPSTFAGISADGSRIFYVGAAVSGLTPAPGPLFVCDVTSGPCSGPGAHPSVPIAANARFVNVSEDGSRVYLTSTEQLNGEGTVSVNNLYAWDTSTGATKFIAVLDPQDLQQKGFEGIFINLIQWPNAMASLSSGTGRGVSPTRSTPDGSVLVFQSHASVTDYDSEKSTQIYRYDSAAAPASSLVCVSCDPGGAPPGADATLVSFSTDPLKSAYTVLTPNVTDDGETVFFESPERLLPEDANTVQDVYEWRAQGSEWCKRPGGCLALISSGQADTGSHLYGMSADGHDVFLSTIEKLAGADVIGSSSIYDARVGGGIPDSPTPAPCQGDACQGEGSIPPALPGPASSAIGGSDTNKPAPPSCPKGKRSVKRKGVLRCVAAHPKKAKRHHKSGRRAHHDRRAHR